jgi:membrane associated rhomboid family serine protease
MFVDTPTRATGGLNWAAPLLAMVAAAVFLAAQFQDDPTAWLQRGGVPTGLAHGPWRLADAPTLLTSLFLHGSAWHLLGNGLFLLIFGVPAERALGSWRLLVVFLAGGLLANALAAVLIDAPGRVVVGASGAISSIIGAYFVLLPRASLGVVVPLGLWLEFVRAPAALLIGLWVGLQWALTFVDSTMGAVAWWAHLGGFGIGAVLALLFRDAVRRRKRGR